MNLGAKGKQIKTINARLQYKKIIKLRSSGSVKIVEKYRQRPTLDKTRFTEVEVPIANTILS